MSISMHWPDVVLAAREKHKKEYSELKKGELSAFGTLNTFDPTRPTLGNKYFEVGSTRELSEIDVRKRVNLNNEVVRVYDNNTKEYISVITRFCCVNFDCSWCKKMRFAEKAANPTNSQDEEEN